MLQAEKGNAAPKKEVADPTTTEVAKEVTVEKAGVGFCCQREGASDVEKRINVCRRYLSPYQEISLGN